MQSFLHSSSCFSLLTCCLCDSEDYWTTLWIGACYIGIGPDMCLSTQYFNNILLTFIKGARVLGKSRPIGRSRFEIEAWQRSNEIAIEHNKGAASNGFSGE